MKFITTISTLAAATLIAVAGPSFGQAGVSSGGSGAGSAGSTNPSGPAIKSGGTATPGTGNAMGKGATDAMASKSGMPLSQKNTGSAATAPAADKAPVNGNTNGPSGTAPTESNQNKSTPAVK